MIRGVIFDLFHTLVDPEDYRPKEFHRGEALADLLGVDKKKFSAYWENTSIRRYSTQRPSIEYVKEFLANEGKAPSARILAEADEVIGRYQDLAILNPRQEVVRSLKLLKKSKLKMGLLSNAEEREVRSWPSSSLAQHFNFTAFSYITGKLKPDPEAYQIVLSGLGVDPSQCAFVGDGGSDELRGARRANIGVVVFIRHFVSRDGIHSDAELQEFATQADLSVDDFEDLHSKLLV